MLNVYNGAETLRTQHLFKSDRISIDRSIDGGISLLVDFVLLNMSNNGGDWRRRILFFLVAFASTILNLKKAALLTDGATLLSEDPKTTNFRLEDKVPANSSLKLVIGKTISFKDVSDTIIDMETITTKYSRRHRDNDDSNQRFDIEWKLFCYQNETYHSLLQRYDEQQWKQDYNAEIYFRTGKNKIYFWHRYLNPKTLSSEVDYIWMMDGDIQIRHMAWYCFWNIVAKFQPSIFAPALMTNMDNANWESRKIYVGSTHPQKCHTASRNSTTTTTTTTTVQTNHFLNLIAMDVWVVESQLPIFTRAAWEVTYQVFEERVPGWGDFRSMWAPDLFWCQLVDHHLLKSNDTDVDRVRGRPFMKWRKAKKTCNLDRNITHYMTETNDNRYYYDNYSGRYMPHACMIIHATPIQDLDSRNIKAHAKGKESEEFQKAALADLDQYNKGVHQFKSLKIKARLQLYRAYLSNDKTDYQCQACKHTGCLS
jgi:hypothetical protein